MSDVPLAWGFGLTYHRLFQNVEPADSDPRRLILFTNSLVFSKRSIVLIFLGPRHRKPRRQPYERLLREKLLHFPIDMWCHNWYGCGTGQWNASTFVQRPHPAFRLCDSVQKEQSSTTLHGRMLPSPSLWLGYGCNVEAGASKKMTMIGLVNWWTAGGMECKRMLYGRVFITASEQKTSTRPWCIKCIASEMTICGGPRYSGRIARWLMVIWIANVVAIDLTTRTYKASVAN